jgi:membrane protein
MPLIGSRAAHVLKNPWRFAWGTLKAFRANQGLLLAGAVAYYALLSIVPLLILSVIALSHFIAQDALLQTLGRYLEWLMPGQSGAIVGELDHFMAHRDVIGWVLLASMIFFSSLAFTVLENAMSVIFHHRVAIHRRHFLISALLPYAYVLCLGLGLLLVTLVAGSLQAMGQRQVDFLGHVWSLDGVSGTLLYLLGFAGEVFILASVYLVMPVGRMTLKHALIGALVAAHGLRLADHRHRGAAQPGSGGHAAAAGRPGDFRVRAHRPARCGAATEAVHDAARMRARLRPETTRPCAPNRAAASPA